MTISFIKSQNFKDFFHEKVESKNVTLLFCYLTRMVTLQSRVGLNSVSLELPNVRKKIV